MRDTPPVPYGLPLYCPKCPPKHFFGWLKLPGLKTIPCPNCGTALVSNRKKTRK